MPALETLHERHYGITPAVGAGLAEAASVALSRHANPPAVIDFHHVTDGRQETYAINWKARDERARAAWANETDMIEAAACAVALATAEADLGLLALARVRPRGGADYWVGPPNSQVNAEDGELDLEGAIRFEVSGIDACASEAAMLYRLARKVEQVRRGGDDSGFAAVVAFSLMLVGLRVT